MLRKIVKCVCSLGLLTAMVCALVFPAAASTTDEMGNEIVVIVLDSGHGAVDSGTCATYGGVLYEEKDLTLKIAQYCKEYLEENYWNVKVLMTRNEDTSIKIAERVQFAVDNDADFLLSIHLNANTGKARGAMALVPAGVYNPVQGSVSRNTATSILKQLEGLGIRNRGFLEKTYSTSRYPNGSPVDSYLLVRYGVQQNMPAIIMEQCFLDNSSDFYAFLSTEGKLKQLGIANAKGLAQTLGLEDISKKPTVSNSENNEGTPFADVFANKWYYDDVTYVYKNGLMNGITENTFSPDSKATRAMVVTLLYRMEGSQEKASAVSFTDVSASDWYYNEVEWAYANGVTNGTEPGMFSPNVSVTREQFVTFLYRYAQEKRYAVESDQSLSGFSDEGKISDYAQAAMRWAVEKDIVKGYEDGTVGPKKTLNRAELAALMHRFDEYLQTEEPVEPETTVPETIVTEAPATENAGTETPTTETAGAEPENTDTGASETESSGTEGSEQESAEPQNEEKPANPVALTEE